MEFTQPKTNPLGTEKISVLLMRFAVRYWRRGQL